MPTVILLDVSLSMCRPVSQLDDANDEYQRLNLGVHGINTVLDYCSAKNKQEFFSLIVFSSLFEYVEAFTRDYDKIKSSLNNLRLYDKTFIEAGLTAATSIIVDEWGYVTPCQVILITDGSTGTGEGSLTTFLDQYKNTDGKGLPLPFPFPSKLHIVCLASQNEPCLERSLLQYRELISLNRGQGHLWTMEQLTLSSVHDTFKQLAEQQYAPMPAKLHCGNLKSNILIIPAPQPYKQSHDFEHIDICVADDLQIVGFLDILDIASPPALSRHLLLPTTDTDIEGAQASDAAHGSSDEEDVSGGSNAEFTVLLHGSLKVENMVALVKLSTNWYGMLYSWADTKKKSNLMLSIFTPGNDVISWLGSIGNLTPYADFSENPYERLGKPGEPASPFPVPSERRSYSQNCVVWIKPSGLQTEIQKVLRHARKLPEKLGPFYEELNRVRRAILSFGFKELFSVIGDLIDRECTQLPKTAHNSVTLQLTHAANMIRQPCSWDYYQNVEPLNTDI